jgi:hypothetical protein
VPVGYRALLPEICQKTTLRAASFRLTMQPSTAVLTCAVVWRCEVSLGVVNPRRIDGNDGVAGSVPVEGSMLCGSSPIPASSGKTVRHRLM